MKNQAANNGTFIPKPGFTVVQNSVARDWNLSSGALGLYTRIQSYITMENITLTKGSLMERVPEGEYAFNTAWNRMWRMCWIPFCRQSPRGRSKTCRST